MNTFQNIIRKFKSFIMSHKYITYFVNGVIFATPFMLEWLFPLTFLGLIIFFYSININFLNKTECEKKSHITKCFITFFLFFMGMCLTVYTLFLKLYPFEGFDFSKAQGIGIVLFAWIASSAIHAFMGGAILCLSNIFKISPIIYAASCGALWVIFEYSLSLGFLAFPWINISVALVKFLPFLQTASVFGNGIITFITVFSCCCIGLFFKYKNKKVLIKVASVTLVANLVLGCVLFILPEKKGKEVSVCIIQGNLTMGEKWESGILTSALRDHDKLIRQNLENEKYDIVLMAETVFPAIYTENGLIYRTLSKIAEEYDVTIIFGVILRAESTKTYNAIMAIYPDGTVSEPYIKRRLVPFGEKLPTFDIIGAFVPSLKELNTDSSYIEGTKSITVSDHQGTVYGPLVCYDSVFPEFSRENVLNGAEIIAVSTNDSWYKDGAAVRQHQSHSVIRAIETGRYVFRSANTGISCVINSKGVIIQESEILKEDSVCTQGYTLKEKNLYVIFGNISLYFSFFFIFIMLFYKMYKKLIKKQNS